MAKSIIIINGYAGAGKDTFVKFVTQHLENNGGGAENLSSITPVWDLLKGLGIPMDIKSARERKLAADVKAALDDYDFAATNLVLMRAIRLLHKVDDNNFHVFIHMREPRAIQHSLEYVIKYKVRTLFIARPQPKLEIGNVADDSVNDFNYEYIIHNDKDLETLDLSAETYSHILSR